MKATTRPLNSALWLSAGALCLVLASCQADSPPPAEDPPPAAQAEKKAPARHDPAATQSAEPAVKQPIVLVPEPLPLTSEELAAGWLWLFDGSTLFGWQAASQANWHVEDGEIRVSEGEAGLLCSTANFGDYELLLEFKAAAGTNSGLFLQTPMVPSDPATDCYELNIAPSDNPFPTGSLVKRSKYDGTIVADSWQQLHVTVRQGHIVVLLDGDKVMDYQDPAPLRSGRIGLQLNEGAVAFRNIRLRPLLLQSIFNGKDLSGWKTYPELASRFIVSEPGVLNVKDGRGQLETEQSYGDFVLQLECITHADSLNSGIFFRCIPGEAMNGYECQIHNGIKQGDTTQPVDCGTGGIFRRTTARRVVAQDQQWFQLTVLAHGPQISTWVNGFQVSDWQDERPADPNPRSGLRVEAGTIMIQGHDPTTDISFRNLRIAEIPTAAAGQE